MHTPRKRLSTAAITTGLLVALMAIRVFSGGVANAATATATKLQPISPATVFVLPSTKQCVSRNQLTIRFHKLAHISWISASVKVNGKRVLSIRRSQLATAVRLGGLPGGSFVLSVTVKASDGRSVTATRDYRGCVTLPVPPPVPLPVPPPALPPVLPQPPVSSPPVSTPPSSSEGHYTGTDPQEIERGDIGFYVSPAGNLQDVYVETTKLPCTPSKVLYDHFEMAEAHVGAEGAFSQEGEQSGEVETAYKEFALAHIAYTLSGHLAEGHATGVFREEVSYDNGTKYSCSTGNQSFTASRDESQSAPSLPASEGHYTGTDPQDHEHGDVEFYISPAGNLQDVSVETTVLPCAPSKIVYDHFEMPEVTVGPEGAFSHSGEQEGMVETAYDEYEPAHITYTFSGHVHGAGKSGEPRLAGVYREDVTYNNGTSYSCTTSDQSWTATRDETKQGAASIPAEEGSYTGTDPQNREGGNVKLYVAPGGNLQDVFVETTELGCGSSKIIYDHFEMPEVTVGPEGAFSHSGEQDGMVETAYNEYEPAHITYTLSGHVHGADAAGEQRIAGVYREDITYNNGTKHSCSTSNQSWTASRDEQQGPASFPAAMGSYLGSDPQDKEHGNITFSVSSAGKLQSVAVALTQLGCGGSKIIYDHFEMAEVPVAGNGSFATKIEESRSVETAHEEFNEGHITYTLSGHVHGANAAGKQRIAGVYREDITYNNGTQYTCSTSNQFWTASHS
jgi:hypothetical protein